MGDVKTRAVIRSIEQLDALVSAMPGLFVRFSKGPDVDATRTSVDHESGLELPGLSVNPLDPADWWTKPRHEWLSRQICKYAHLQLRAPDDRVGWVLTGETIGRGPDNEPLLRPWWPIAILDDVLVTDAWRTYNQRFNVGRDSTN